LCQGRSERPPCASAALGDPVATFSRISAEVNAERISTIRRARSSNHYDIDTSVKALQHAIHSSFSGAGLAGRPSDGMGEDIDEAGSG
jgi:hypothetical protein